MYCCWWYSECFSFVLFYQILYGSRQHLIAEYSRALFWMVLTDGSWRFMLLRIDQWIRTPKHRRFLGSKLISKYGVWRCWCTLFGSSTAAMDRLCGLEPLVEVLPNATAGRLRSCARPGWAKLLLGDGLIFVQHLLGEGRNRFCVGVTSHGFLDDQRPRTIDQ